MRKYILLFFCLSLMACKEKSLSENSMFILPLSDNIHKGKLGNQAFMDLVTDVAFIPLELTDSSLLQHCYIAGEYDRQLFLYDLHSIYMFDSEDGTFLSCIKRNGEGPEEYLHISDVAINKNESSVHILDNNKKRINSYSLNGGHFISSVNSDSIVSFEGFNDKDWLFFNSPMAVVNYEIGISDYSWNNRKGILKRNYNPDFKNLIPINDFMKYNNAVYLLNRDTIYAIRDKDRIEPFLILDKKDYSIPDEIAYNIKNKQKRHDYIWGETCCFSEKYYFTSYYYNKKVYYDIWNLDKRELCYRNIVESPSEKRGFPVTLNSSTIYVWPIFVKDDMFYCIVDEVESGIYLGIEDKDLNSSLVKFRIK